MEFFSEFFWLEFLSEYFIKSMLVLSLGFFLFYLCRRKPAALRHFILSVSLIGLLILPLLSTIHSGWETRLLPFWTNENGDSSRSVVSSASYHSMPFAHALNAPQTSQTPGKELEIHPSEDRTTDTAWWFLLKYSFLFVWMSGTIFILVRQIFGIYGAFKLSREAEDLKSSFWRHLLNRFLKALSIKKKVALLTHKKVKIPLTWGWLKPMVIMPDGSNLWTSKQRESALYHELSHVKRGDFFVLMLARISLGFYWFNPLCWLIFRMIKTEQEKACDELVLKTGIKPSTYAANLLSIQRSVQSPWNPPVTALGVLERSQLNDRLLAILKQKLKLKEVKMRTKIFFSALVILTITFLGMARPSASKRDFKISNGGAVFPSENSSAIIKTQEEKKEKKNQNKTDKKEDKDKKKDIYIWHIDEGKEGEVEVSITDKGIVRSFTIEEPVIIIKKDESGKEIAITSEGEAIEIKKGQGGTWVVKGDAAALYEQMEEIDLGEGSVITLKTTTKDGEKTIEIEAPAVIVKKIGNSSKSATVKVNEEGGEEKFVVVAPRVHVEQHPDVRIHIKEVELKNIYAKLKEIHKRLSKRMGSKTEEEEQALKEMEEILKKMEKKLDAMKKESKHVALSIHEEPHRIHLKHGQAITIKHKTGTEGQEKDWVYINKDEGHLMCFVDEEGEVTFLASMKLEKTQKQAFADAIDDVESKLPDGCELESDWDEDSGMATITIKGQSLDKETMDQVIDFLKDLKEKLEIKN